MPDVRALLFVDVPHRLAGAQRSLLAAARGLAAHGVAAKVVFPGPGMCLDAFQATGIPVRIVPAPPALMVFQKKLLRIGLAERASIFVREVYPYCRVVARAIEEERADVVHFNTPRGILLGGVAALLAHRPRVLHVRGIMDPFAGLYWTTIQAMATRFILVAHALRAVLNPLVRRRSRVVYNGVAIPAPADRQERRHALEARLGLSPGQLAGETVFASLSSTVPSKGLHHLIEAAARVHARGPKARWILAGDGNDDHYLAWLHRRARELGIGDRVHFVGFVDETAPLLGGVDALVLPSVWRETLTYEGRELEVRGNEGLPRSILEAMASRLPVVATDTGGVREQVEDGRTGFLVPPSDPALLAEALAQVASDPTWRAHAGARALEVVRERFPVDSASAGLAAVLRELA
jgi:glycosyltransferase involved in cell wall biosynthesis